MWQEIFNIPFGSRNIPVYGFGLMLVIGFLATMQLAKFLANRSGLDGEAFVNAGLLALVTGIIGARLSHVLENLSEFTDPTKTVGQNLWNVINLRSGGLTYYGGFLLAFPSLIAFAIYKKIPIPKGMDIIAPCLMIGLGFGRIGCFLNGCCYGARCDLPWAVSFPYYSYPYVEEVRKGELEAPRELLRDDTSAAVLKSPAEVKASRNLRLLAEASRSQPLHPAQLYSAFTAFLLAGVLYAYYTTPHIAGRVFALMMMLEGICRYLLELVRDEPPVIGTWSLSMVLGLLVAIGGAVLWFAFGYAGKQIRSDWHPAIA